MGAQRIHRNVHYSLRAGRLRRRKRIEDIGVRRSLDVENARKTALRSRKCVINDRVSPGNMGLELRYHRSARRNRDRLDSDQRRG